MRPKNRHFSYLKVSVYFVLPVIAGLALCLHLQKSRIINAESNTLLAPAITASNTDALVTDADGDGIADPGDVVEYTVTVNNTAGAGNDATGMIFTDTLDANMTLVPGSVNASPIAGNDAFPVTGNVRIQVPDGATDLLANDIDPDTGNNTGLTATAESKKSAQCAALGVNCTGNNVTINADGSFSYNPPAGYDGADSFDYTVTDASGASSTGTANLTVSGMIWFIQNGAPACTTLAAGCGRLTNPFSTLAAFQALNNGAGNNPAANDNIFIYSSGTAYTGGVGLLSGQKLIGQGATASLATIAGITLAANSDALPATGGARPNVTNAAGNGITLNSGNLLRGLNAGGSTFAIDDNGTVGALSISEMLINSAGGGFRADSGGTLAVTLDSITTAGGANGINLASITSGSFAVTGAVTVSNTTGDSISLNGNASTFSVSGLTQINTTADNFIGIHFSGGSGAINFANIEINGRRDKGIRVSGGNRNIMTGAVDIDNTNSDVASAIEILAPTGGAISFGDTDINVNNVAGTGIEIQNNTASVSFGAGSTITGSTGTDFLVNQGAGNVTYNGSITNAGGGMITVTARTGGTIDFQGNLTHNTAATAISLSGNTSGTIQFTGATKTLNSSTATAVNSTGTGATIIFAGGLDIDTTSGGGISATGGGTINVCATNPCAGGVAAVNTIDTGSGTALNVQNTTIGASGLTFRSISQNGGSKGISLNNTGAGGFTVTGTDGADADTLPDAGTGGTIQNTTTRGAEFKIVGGTVSIGGMNFTNAATTQTITGVNCGLNLNLSDNNVNCNSAIHLESTSGGVNLTSILIDGSVQGGINGNAVANLTINSVEVRNVGNEVGENGILIKNLSGSGSLTNANLHDNEAKQLHIINTTGTLTAFNITGSNFANAPAPNGGQGVLLESFNSGTAMTVSVSGSTFQNFFTNAHQVATNSGSTQNVTLSNNTFTNANAWTVIQASDGGRVDFNVTGNSGATGALSGSNAINIKTDNADLAGAGSIAIGNISSNTIGNNNISSGAVCGGGCSGISVHQRHGGTLTANIVGNTIRHVDANGIYITGGSSMSGDGGKLNVVVTGNLIKDPDTVLGVPPLNAINIQSGVVNTDSNCVTATIGGLTNPGTFPSTTANAMNRIEGNWDPTPAGIGNEIFLWERFAATVFNLPGLSGGAAAWVSARNSITSADGTSVAVSGTFGNAAVCPGSATFTENLSNEIEITEFIAPFSNISSSCTKPDISQPLPLQVKTGIKSSVRLNPNPAFNKPTGTMSGESAAIEDIKPESKATSNLEIASAFLAEVAGKISSAISPIVYSQEKKQDIPVSVSGETITVGAPSGFTLPASKSVTIKFRAQINNVPGLAQVSNQGTVSGGNFSNVLTDDPSVGGGTDPTVTLVDRTTVTVSSSQNPSVVGQTVTFTATLTGNPAHAAGNPSGTVEFFDGATSLGTAPAVAGATNTATASITVSSLTAGNHTITAQYSGGGQFNAGSGNMTGNPQVVSNTAVWDGSASAAWTDANNWTTNFAPTSANDVSIPASGVTNNPTISTAITINSITEASGRTLTINAGNTLTVTGGCTINGTLSVAGAFTCGTFTGTGTVSFTGAAAQNVPAFTFQNLTINNASGVNLAGDATVNGTLTLTSGNVNAGANNLILGAAATVSRTSGHVIGNVRKNYNAASSFTFPVGTANGYSPATINVTAGTFPLAFNVRAVQGAQPALSAANSLQRYWQVSPTGGSPTANLTFNYLQTDVAGTETSYRIMRVNGSEVVSFEHNPPNVTIDTTNNVATVNGVTAFSDWTLSALAPTAANVAVAGRVLTTDGRGVFRAEVQLTDSNGQTRTARTNPFGYYRFENIPVGAIYTINVRHKEYVFAPQVINITDEATEITIVASP